MIKIPFYNHYFEEQNGLGITMNKVFNVRGIKVVEYPCLCDLRLCRPAASPLVLFHGIRPSGEKKEDFQCYDRSRRIMLDNPQTTFYVWGINFSPEEGYRSLLSEENIKPANCKMIRVENLVDSVNRITDIMKRIVMT